MADPVGAIVGSFDRMTLRILQSLNMHLGYMVDKSQEFYQYAVDLDAVAGHAAGIELNQTIQITQESQFICTHIAGSMRCLIAGDTADVLVGQIATSPVAVAATNVFTSPDQGPGAFQYLITDGSSDRQKGNQFIEAHAGIGSGTDPLTLAKPMVLRNNSAIRIQVRPTFAASHAAQQWRFTLVFTGFKVYDAEALDLTRRR